MALGRGRSPRTRSQVPFVGKTLELKMQLELNLEFEKSDCEHKSGFVTLAMVPPGFYCMECDKVTFRYMPPPKNQPELIGYVSADWSWKYEKLRPWTGEEQPSPC